MQYERIYNQIVERARTRVLEGYIEKHHIIPKCMDGTNDESNLVKLTAKEHFVCHMLLCRIYPDNVKIWYAALAMTMLNGSSNRKRSYRVSSRQYAEIKNNLRHTEEHCKRISEGKKLQYKLNPRSEEALKKISEANKGKTLSEETIRKRTETRKQRQDTYLGRKGYTASEETRRKLSEAGKGRVCSDETKKKLSEARLGYIMSEESIRKRTESRKKNKS